MKLLYMLFTLFTESRYPGTNPVPQELVSTQIPTDVILKPSLFFINMRRGYDERYNNDYNETETQLYLSLLFYYYEQYQFLQNYHYTSLEEVINNKVVNEVLNTSEITPFRMSAGGLFDDWNREI